MALEAKNDSPKPWTVPEHVNLPQTESHTIHLQEFSKNGQLAPTLEGPTATCFAAVAQIMQR